MQVSLHLTPERFEEINALAQECGFSDRTELINTALTLVRWVATKTKDGQEVAAIDELNRHYTKLDMPFIARLRPAPN